jgi:hypothetical protein
MARAGTKRTSLEHVSLAKVTLNIGKVCKPRAENLTCYKITVNIWVYFGEVSYLSKEAHP